MKKLRYALYILRQLFCLSIVVLGPMSVINCGGGVNHPVTYSINQPAYSPGEALSKIQESLSDLNGITAEPYDNISFTNSEFALDQRYGRDTKRISYRRIREIKLTDSSDIPLIAKATPIGWLYMAVGRPIVIIVLDDGSDIKAFFKNESSARLFMDSLKILASGS